MSVEYKGRIRKCSREASGHVAVGKSKRKREKSQRVIGQGVKERYSPKGWYVKTY